MKLAIFGSTGMLGHKLFHYFEKKHEVCELSRDAGFNVSSEAKDLKEISDYLSKNKFDFVFNCVGVIKQIDASKDAIASIEINSLWPHQLARLCANSGAKLVHFSTDCVFSGSKGNYSELDSADAHDIYGRSKLLGEIAYDHCLTLRTSIIGHELKRHASLIDWFLAQESSCKGYTKAIYSGFPTIVLAKILDEKILPAMMAGGLSGVWNLSSDPIDKYDLLCRVAKRYGKNIDITPVSEPRINRSLNSDALRNKLGFIPQTWDEMVDTMYQDYKKCGLYHDR